MPKKSKMQILILQESEDGTKETEEKDRDLAPIDGDAVTDESTYYDARFLDQNGNSYFAFNMQGMLFWNYYATYISLFCHLSIHIIFLGWWCSGSKLVYLYSFQVVLLHAYSWAIPDRRYAAWIQEHRSFFYGLSALNIIWYLMGMIGGIYMYNSSKDGIIQYMGVSCVAYTFFS